MAINIKKQYENISHYIGCGRLNSICRFLINPEAWGDIFAVLFVFTVIMLISFGIVILSYDEDDYEYPEDHPFLRDFRKRHEDDSD